MGWDHSYIAIAIDLVPTIWNPDHSKTRQNDPFLSKPFEIRTPLENWSIFDHSKTGHVQFSDPHCNQITAILAWVTHVVPCDRLWGCFWLQSFSQGTWPSCQRSPHRHTPSGGPKTARLDPGCKLDCKHKHKLESPKVNEIGRLGETPNCFSRNPLHKCFPTCYSLSREILYRGRLS